MVELSTDMDAVFRALASQPRRQMLRRLTEQDLTVSQLAEPLDMSLAATEILKLVPNERIVFAWGFVGPDRAGPVFDSRLTVTFSEEQDGETKLTLIHERLDALRAAMPDGAPNVGTGWEMVLDKLQRLTAS